MKHLRLGGTAIAIFFLVRGAGAQILSGFSATSGATQVAAEKKFDGYLDTADVDLFIKTLSSRPHHLGSPGDQENTNFIASQYKSWGFDVRVETFYALFATPKTRVLEMTAPTQFRASLMEQPLREDATSGQVREQLPPYNCYSADGDVTGELVYLNYGMPDDYDYLRRLGIDVKGKIVITRYGKGWRGLKPKLAQEHGAIGCIIYSDPADDGYVQGDVYPKGAFKNEWGVQRGSVLDMLIYPGDPLTPGIGATKDAKRLDRKDAATLIKIPVLPISYHDAAPLVHALEGPVAPPEWRGGLAMTYHVGPGKSTVHLKLEFDWQLKPVNDVVAMMPGSRFPDEWVIRGNHYDAWVNGAADPISGQAAMLTEAKAVGQLAKTGWKPARTIVYCSWDGEEEGLLGSTEWAEQHAAELQQKAVAYINSDGNGRGFLGASGSHALEPMINEVARDVTDPETGISVLERRRSREEVAAVNDNKKLRDLLGKDAFKIGALGSGSDYSAFTHHLGVPSIDMGYGGEDPGGEYHSIYDSYDDYRRFKDPTFQYGVTLAKTAGRVMLRLASAERLPFDFTAFEKTLGEYIADIKTQLEKARENTELENRLIAGKQFQLAADPTKKLLPPDQKSEVPYVDFSPLENALHGLDTAASALKHRLGEIPMGAGGDDSINRRLYRAEQCLLSDAGLPRRGWYRHTIYAPGFYTGYAVKTVPGVREAMEQRNWLEMQREIAITAVAVEKLASYLNGIAR